MFRLARDQPREESYHRTNAFLTLNPPPSALPFRLSPSAGNLSVSGVNTLVPCTLPPSAGPPSARRYLRSLVYGAAHGRGHDVGSGARGIVDEEAFSAD